MLKHNTILTHVRLTIHPSTFRVRVRGGGDGCGGGGGGAEIKYSGSIPPLPHRCLIN
jgi:hypothetical protein